MDGRTHVGQFVKQVQVGIGAPATLALEIADLEVAGRRLKARASLAPMYDPKSDRVRM